MGIITENQLDVWVRGNARVAQGVIVELVWRLVAASCPKPRERRFPRGDCIEQSGPAAGIKACYIASLTAPTTFVSYPQERQAAWLDL
jgi:hypothetical protein